MSKTAVSARHLRVVAAHGALLGEGAPTVQPTLVVCPFGESLIESTMSSRKFNMARPSERNQYEEPLTWHTEFLKQTLRHLSALGTAVIGMPLFADRLIGSDMCAFAMAAPVGRVVVHGETDPETSLGWSQSITINPRLKSSVHLLSLEYLLPFGIEIMSTFRALNVALRNGAIADLNMPPYLAESPTHFALRDTPRGKFAGFYLVEADEDGVLLGSRLLD